MEGIPCSSAGQWLGTLYRAAAFPVCLHGQSSHHRLRGLPTFQGGTGQKEGLIRVGRKGKGCKCCKALCHLRLVIWLWFTLAAMCSPQRVALESLIQAAAQCVHGPNTRPRGRIQSFYLRHLQKIAALSSSLCLGLVLTVTATYHVMWQHCSVSTHVTDVCQAGRDFGAPSCFFTIGSCPGIIPGLCTEACSSRSPGRRELTLVRTPSQHPGFCQDLGLCGGGFELEGVRKIKLLHWGLSYLKFPC